MRDYNIGTYLARSLALARLRDWGLLGLARLVRPGATHADSHHWRLYSD